MQFIKMIAEENQDASSDVRDQELAFLKAVDAMARSFEATSVSEEEDKARLCEYERECRERASKDQCDSEQKPFPGEGFQLTNDKVSSASLEALNGPMRKVSRRSMLESIHISDQRKIIFLYELLSACVADATKEEKKKSRVRSGYDARHRVALRLLATWLDIEWIKMVRYFCILFIDFPPFPFGGWIMAIWHKYLLFCSCTAFCQLFDCKNYQLLLQSLFPLSITANIGVMVMGDDSASH